VRRSRIPVVLCATAAVIALAACSSGGSSSGNASTTGSGGKSGNYSLSELDATISLLNLPTYAVQQSIGAQYGVKVSETSVTGGGTANTEFAGGTGDLLVAGVDSPIRIDQQGVTGMTVLGSIAQSNVWVLVTKKGSPIHSLSDLAGKTVGISGPGAVSDIALLYELKKAGVNPSSVHIVSLGAAPSQLAALEAGHADAVQLISPVLDSALKSGEVQILLDMRKENYPALVISARTQDVKANPKAYCAYMSALKTGMNKVMTDSSFATSAAQQLMGTSLSTAAIKEVLGEYDATTYDPNLDFTQAQYNTAKSMLLESGVVKAANFPTYQDLTAGQPKC